MDEYLKKNGFGSLDKYNEYVHETSRMDEASKDLGKKIKSEQISFDAVYASLINILSMTSNKYLAVIIVNYYE